MAAFNSRLLPSLSAPVLLFALACADHDQPVEAPQGKNEALEQGQAPAEQAAAEQSHKGKHFKRGHRQGDPMKLLHAALRHLDLSEQQRTTLTQLRDSLRVAEADAALHPHEAFRAQLAEAMRSGSVDRAKLNEATVEVETAITARTKRAVDALNQVHATLTLEQRQTLVEKLQARIHEKAGQGERGHGHAKAHRRFGKHGPGPGVHAFGMLRGLELSEDQKARLEGAPGPKKSPEAMQEMLAKRQAERRALLTAFATESFDAGQFVKAEPRIEQLRERLEQKIEFVNEAATILTPAQRRRAAEQLEMQRGFGHDPWQKQHR